MSRLLDVYVLLAPVLREQSGLVRTSDAAGVGVTAQQLSRLTETGLLERRSRGLYASSAHHGSWSRRALGAQLRGGPRAVLSHGAAARVLGLEQTWVGRTPTIELTVPRGARPRGDLGVRLHESAHLDPEVDRIEVGPFRVTSAAWTVAALCARMDLGRAERMIDAAIANGHTTRERLQEMAARWWHTPGVVVLRAALLRHVDEGRLTRSEAERLFLRILRDAGLPIPEANVRVVDASGRTRYLDFAYPDLRVCIEIDVHRSHGTTLGRSLDGSRQNDLVPDWLPLRFDAADLGDPRKVADQVRRALRAVGHLPR